MAMSSKAATTSSLYQSIAYIIVGPQKQKFGIHKNLLSHHSTFFKAALNGSFKEAQAGIVELPADDPTLFDIVKTWLYSKKLLKDQDGDDIPCSISELVRLYILGDLRGMPHLKNAVVDDLIRLYQQHQQQQPRTAVLVMEIPYVYENTPPSSPLRTLFVDLVCWSSKLDPQDAFHETLLQYYPKAFLVDLVMAVENLPVPSRERNMTNSPYFLSPCLYHEHAEVEEGCARSTGALSEFSFGRHLCVDWDWSS